MDRLNADDAGKSQPAESIAGYFAEMTALEASYGVDCLQPIIHRLQARVIDRAAAGFPAAPRPRDWDSLTAELIAAVSGAQSATEIGNAKWASDLLADAALLLFGQLDRSMAMEREAAGEVAGGQS